MTDDEHIHHARTKDDTFGISVASPGVIVARSTIDGETHIWSFNQYDCLRMIASIYAAMKEAGVDPAPVLSTLWEKGKNN